MEANGINWLLFFFQLVNFALLIAWIMLAYIALRRLGRAGLSPAVTIGWAALILLLPVLGAVAFLVAGPGRRRVS
jgi:uncharacterized membrane protein YhaH (DUF805 family)